MLKTNQKNLILGGLVALVLVMGIAFSVFSTNLNIEGTSNISTTWDVRITNIETKNIKGHAKDDEENPASYNELTANFNALLYYEGDSITYDITLKNNGTLDAALDKNVMPQITSNNDKIKVELTGFKTKGDVITKGGGEAVTTVKITYLSETALADTDNNIKQLLNKENITPQLMDTETKPEASITITYPFSQERASGADPVTKYLVSYDCDTNGGTSCSDFDEYLYGSDDIDLTKEGTKEGYTFVGWNTDSSATTGINEATVSGNTTLYAIYKKTITVNYAKGDASSIGKESDSCDIYNNGAVTCTKTLPSITTDSTHKVDGWYKGNEKVGNANASYTFTEDTNLTAGITAIDIVNVNTLDITLDEDTYTYDGTAKTPTVTVKDGETTLTKDTDYTVEYSNNTDNGTATVTISGANHYNSETDKIYNGTDTKEFTINKADPTITLSANSGSVVAGGTVKFNESANVAGNFSNVSGTTSVATVSPASYSSVAANTEKEVTVTGVSYGSSTITVTFTPTNTNYNEVTKTYTVSGYNLATTGSCNSNLVYDGTEKTLASGGTGVTYTNNTSTNAVTNQSVTVTAGSEYRFSDGGTSSTLSCSVAKADPTVTLTTPNYGIINPSATMSFTEKADIAGSFGNVSGTTGVATLSPASYSSIAANTEKTVNVTGGSTTGTSTITVTFTPTDSTNYNNKTATYTIRNTSLPTITDNGGGSFTISYGGVCTTANVTCKYSTNGGSSFTTLSGTDKTNSTHTETLSADATVVGRIDYGSNFISHSQNIVAKIPGSSYLTTLSATDSTLITDDYGNIRYSGKNVNNYVCMDSTESTCSDANLYRIIGVFSGIKTTENGTGETRIKLIKATNNGNAYWNIDSDGGTNTNNWTEASLKNTLNSASTAIYSSSLIDDAVWNIGGHNSYAVKTRDMYNYERGTTTYLNRPTTWTGKVALMYPSDYGYASRTCYSTWNLGGGSGSGTSATDYRHSACTGSNWLFGNQINGTQNNEWLLTPDCNHYQMAFTVYWMGNVDTSGIYNASIVVRPTVYLKSDVSLITDGGRDGSSSKPYLLSD